MSDGNLLRHARSPYLLQHAGNPVHWRQWGEAALAEARASHLPILLSVGYAACHWCHVMAHESFEDPETAALMNRHFVNIKVDREERPDIDHIYMSALHALGEQGGWPLTMFLTPDGAPFWGGTYFPPEPRWGRPSFRQVLEGVARAFAAGDDAVAQNVAALRSALRGLSATRPGPLPGPENLDAVAAAVLAGIDPVHGGLGGAPRFPNAPLFRFLWQQYARTGDPACADAVHGLLRGLAMGGIHDHLGGGFCRYSTDAQWLVPHFEKMLYDNAQILELLAFAHAARPDPLYVTRAETLVGWLVREMSISPDASGHHAFAAAQDADSEGEEGRFYVWTESEIDALLGPESAAFKAAYDVRPEGNWEGRTVLRRITPPGAPEAERRLAASGEKLFETRKRRVPPARDGKVLADWNGLMIAALVRAAAVFDRTDWRTLAGSALDFLRAGLKTPDGRMSHAWAEGVVTASGLLQDQASVALAALALYEATGDPARLAQATSLADAAIRHFADGNGGFFQTAADATDVPLARPRSATDNATPSGTGLIATLFGRLHHLTGEPEWRGHAERVLRAFGGAGAALQAMPTLLAASDLLQNAITVVVTGAAGDPATEALLRAARAAPDPAICVMHAAEGGVPLLHPAHGKAVGEASAAFVCRASACSLPVHDPEALRPLLRRAPP